MGIYSIIMIGRYASCNIIDERKTIWKCHATLFLPEEDPSDALLQATAHVRARPYTQKSAGM
jgi:hypothetical protein